MGTKEKRLTNARLKEINPETERLFRINAGEGQVGKQIRGGADIRKVVNKMPNAALNGAVLILGARPLKAAPAGWADLSGWETVEITPDMVGRKIAQFKMVEVKATGKLSDVQKKMRDLVLRMGGSFEILE